MVDQANVTDAAISAEFVRCHTPEITEDNFEDLLAIDDVLLDYFNAFLALPVFSRPLYYNRLTGTFLDTPRRSVAETSENAAETTSPASATAAQLQQQQLQPLYGATDEERERMMQWAKDERLPIFFRTRLFREYKLCRLLLRALDDRRGASSIARGRHSTEAAGSAAAARRRPSGYNRVGTAKSSASSLVRGYSRQTADTCSASSLSNSADNSGDKDDHGDDDDLDDMVNDRMVTATTGIVTDGVVDGSSRRTELFKYLRPGSRAISLPIYAGLGHVAKRRTQQQISAKVTSTETALASDSTNTKSSDNSDDRQTTTTADDQRRQQQYQRFIEDSSSESTNDQLSDALTSTYDKSSDTQSHPALPTSKLRLNFRRRKFSSEDTQILDQSINESTTDSSIATRGEFVTMATPMKLKHRNVVYEDIADDDEAAELAMPNGILASVMFANDVISDAQTEEGVRSLEGKHHMTLQEMKELVLSSVNGMSNFRKFLQLTVGRHLFDFWLDCESYKDTVEDLDDDHHRLLRSRLFRDIQEKYKNALTPDAVQQFMYAASHFGLKQTIFIHAQYNVLRRLRAYWVPRYLIHLERVNELRIGMNVKSSSSVDLAAAAAVSTTAAAAGPAESTELFQSVTVVDNWSSSNSKGSTSFVGGYGNKLLVHNVAGFGGGWSVRRPLSVQQSSARNNGLDEIGGKPRLPINKDRLANSNEAKCRSLRDRFLEALKAEREGGGPLQLYLQRCDELELLCNLLFWQEVTEYGKTNMKTLDSKIHAAHTWDIYNKYIATDALFNIGLPKADRDTIHRKLQTGRHLLTNDIFSEAVAHSINLLEEAWVGYLKQDFKSYLDCGLRTQQTPPSTANDVDVEFDVTTQQLVVAVRKTAPETSGNDEFGIPSELQEAQRALERQKRLERRKVMERERRKAIRAAKQRLKEAKLRARDSANKVGNGNGSARDDFDFGDGDLPEIVDNPTFHTALINKSVMTSFKKHLQETNNKDILAAVNLYLEIDSYNQISGSGPQYQKKKDEQAMMVNRLYHQMIPKMKSGSGAAGIKPSITSKKERPKSPQMREMHADIQPLIDAAFDRYCNTDEFTSKFRSQANRARRLRNATDDDDDDDILPAIDTSKPPSVVAAQQGNGRASNIGNPDAETVTLDGSGHHKQRSLQQQQQFLQPLIDDGTTPYNPFAQLLIDYSSLISLTDSTPWTMLAVSDAALNNVDGAAGGTIQDNDTFDSSLHPVKPGKKIPSRVHPTKADKNDFLTALQNAAAGHLPVKMWLFYEFLVHHGELEGNPRLDKDLFFYCEVLKFKEASHAFADEELLRRKVQSMAECYIETQSSSSTSFQVDMTPEIQQKTMKSIQKYLSGKDFSSSLFDEPQTATFKEMLPYWVAFSRTYTPPSGNRPIPLTRQLRERRRKLEEILRWKPPQPRTVTLPLLNKGAAHTNTFTYSLSDGLRWKNGGPVTLEDHTADEGAASDVAGEVGGRGSRSKRFSVASRASRSYSDISGSNNQLIVSTEA